MTEGEVRLIGGPCDGAVVPCDLEKLQIRSTEFIIPLPRTNTLAFYTYDEDGVAKFKKVRTEKQRQRKEQ